MLFLQSVADGSAHDTTTRVPIDNEAGLCLERALLAADETARLAEVERALAADRNLANWALSTAEARLGQTVNRIEEAAKWLAQDLVTELSPVLLEAGAASSSDDID